MLAGTSFCRLLTRPERHPRLAFPGCGAPSRPRIPTDRSGQLAVPRRRSGRQAAILRLLRAGAPRRATAGASANATIRRHPGGRAHERHRPCGARRQSRRCRGDRPHLRRGDRRPARDVRDAAAHGRGRPGVVRRAAPDRGGRGSRVDRRVRGDVHLSPACLLRRCGGVLRLRRPVVARARSGTRRDGGAHRHRLRGGPLEAGLPRLRGERGQPAPAARPGLPRGRHLRAPWTPRRSMARRGDVEKLLPAAFEEVPARPDRPRRYRPRRESASSRSMSRRASLAAMSRRRSWSCLPRARPISSLAWLRLSM